MTPTVHLPRGLQASGKSTLARRIAAATGATHLELDVVRRAVWPDAPAAWDPYSGPGLAVQHEFERLLLRHVLAGRDVIADRTNLTATGRERLGSLLDGRAQVREWDLRWVPLEECIRRDALRPKETRVGADVITATWERWLAPQQHRPTAPHPAATGGR